MAPKPSFNLSTQPVVAVQSKKPQSASSSASRKPLSASLSSRPRSTLSQSTSLPISIFPNDVIFSNVTLGTPHTLTLSLRNTSKKSLTLRLLSSPASSAFSILMLPEKAIAPGLSLPLKVTFYAEKEQQQWNDRIVLGCSGSRKRMEVPLTAFMARCDWHYGLSDAELQKERAEVLDVGVAGQGATQRMHLRVENRGEKMGAIEFLAKSGAAPAQIGFQPSRVSLAPHTFTDVLVECVSPNDQLGLVQVPIVVRYDDDTRKEVNFAMRVVETTLTLLKPQNKASVADSELRFGDLYFGQREEMDLILVNNSPFPQTFTIGESTKSADEDMADDISTGEEEIGGVKGKVSPPFYSQPNHGTLDPFQKIPVKFLFQPTLARNVLGFSSLQPQNRRESASSEEPGAKNIALYKEDLAVEVEETGQKLLVTFEGRAVHPDVMPSEKVLNFGTCATNDYRDIMVTLTNNNQLPIPFSIKKIAHFSASPPKGELKPLETKNIRFTFSPAHLGEFNSNIIVSLLGGKQKISLNMIGEADALGDKKTVVGGTDKLPEDFQRKPKWVKNSRFQPKSLDLSRNRFLEQRKREKEQYTLETTGFAQLRDVKKSRANKEKYNEYLRTMRETKAQSVRRDEVLLLDQHQNELDLGMIPGGGLEEPIPTVSVKRAPLYLAVTTAEERADCALKISPKQLAKLLYGPKMIDFGEMTVFARATKPFAIRNTLPHHIFVELSSRSEVLNIEPQSQVIPPMQTAGFDVEFYAKLPQSVQETIFFTINGHIKIKFVTMADVVSTRIDVSTEEINFKFDDNSLERYITSALTLFNRGNSVAQFHFVDPDPHESSDDMFRVEPAAGEIGPGKDLNVRIIFTPGTQCKATKNFLLQVKGATDERLIKCVADLPESKVKASEKKVEFGVIPVGLKRHKYITLKNGGKQGAVFHVNPVHPDISISPAKGRIMPNSTQKLVVELNPTLAASYDSHITIDIRGGKRVKIELTGESRAPQVELLDCPQNISFGSVYVGAQSPHEIKVKNLGAQVPAILYLDLHSHPDFHVTDANGTRITLDTPDTSRITIASDLNEEEQDDESEDEQDSMNADEDNLSAAAGGSEGVPQHGEKYQIAVPPETVLSFFVVFRPSVVEDHQFKIPLTIAGIAHAPFEEKEFIACALKPRLVISQPIVNFKSRVIQKEGVNMMPHRMIVTLTNEDSKDLKWQIDEEIATSLKDVYRIEPLEGRLMRGHTAQVQIFFTPKELKVYRLEVPIFLDGQTQTPYTHLTLKGAGSNPKLAFDVQEIVLPVVPLGIKSRAIFQVINEGYENLELKYRLPADTSRVPIQLNFIEGKKLSTEKQSVPVEVFFESKKPMSFTAKIDFYDNEDNRFSIPVTCTSDNCLLTNYPYLVYNKDSYMMRSEDDNSAVQLIARDEAEEQGFSNSESDRLSVGYTASVYSSYTTTSSKMSTNTRMLRKIFSRRSTKRLMKWLNLNVLTNPADDLFKTLVFSNGAVLFDIIHFLSGKKAPGKLTKTPSNKKELATSLYEQYEKVLTFLRSYGALLNVVKPHHLLKYDEYRQLLDLPQLKNEQRLSEQAFRYKANAAWLSTLYQVIKLFYLNRVSLKSFKSLPGMDLDYVAESEPSLSKSNLYSLPESVLLKWITFHYNKMSKERLVRSASSASNQSRRGGKSLPDVAVIDEDSPPPFEPKQVKGFGKELADSLALSSVLLSHIPSLASHFSKMRLEPRNAADYEHNARLFVDALKKVRLDYPLQTSDLLQANPRDTLLLCMYLYLNLPQYVPKTTITFAGNLQQSIEKSIELSNPTKHIIEYDVELDNITEVENNVPGTTDATTLRDDEFQLSEKHIVLEPKSTFKYRIVSKPRFSTPPGCARLTLHAKRTGVTKPATMVFLLKNKVRTDRFLQTFDASSTVFEMQRVELDIENPFDRTGLFKIQIQQSNNANKKQHTFLPDPFWYTSDHINIKAKDKKKLHIFYLPFAAGVGYHAKLLFSDPKVGEFVYAIKGTAEEPESSVQSLKILCEAGEEETRDISLSTQNANTDRAFQQLRERNRKYRFTTNDTTKIPEESLKKIKYKVVYSSRFFSGPTEIIIDRSKPNDKCTLPVSFKPKSAGIYPCVIKMISDFDFRVLEIEGTARSPGVNVELQFSVPARKRITQEIPITNNTDQPWKIECALKGDCFSGPKEVRVPPQKTANYPLVFFPKRMGVHEGELVLQNPETLEKYIYTLRGDVEEPLAEDKIELDCMAREEVTYTLTVPNLNALLVEDSKQAGGSIKPITYDVEVDLPFVEVSKQFTVTGATKDLVLNIAPPLGGHHSGAITFTTTSPEDPAQQDQVWYMIDIQAERPPPEQELFIEANVREAAVAEINIANPLNRSITFEVVKEGSGLVGEDFLTLDANESAVYELIYSPLIEADEGGFVSFYNESVGEFWYSLSLTAKSAVPVRIPELRCEIGKKCEHKIKIENPIDQTVSLSVECSNERNFAVQNAPFQILPYETILVPIQYYPSSINQPETATIRFFHPTAGEWIFEAVGVGMKPTSMDSMTVYAEVRRTASEMISFKNPFREKKRFTVHLETFSQQSHLMDANIFKLLVKPSKKSSRSPGAQSYEYNLSPFAALHIPLTFSPPAIGDFTANVVVSLADGSDLKWVYPVRGVTQIVNKAHTYYFNSKSRTRMEKVIAVPLEGLKSEDVQGSGTVFSHELRFEDNKYQQAIKRALILTRIEAPSNARPSHYHTLYFKADYAPLRPFDGSATLKIQRNDQGGIWSFDVQLSASAPDADDTIEIESAMGKSSRISFRLNNVFARTAPFEAYFTPESPFDFSVEPERGVLAANGYEGTQFIVAYTATEYGKSRQGTLVIDTNEMQWRYNIRGLLPPTIRSPQIKSRIENKLSSETKRALEQAQRKRTKNIIAKNILSTAHTTSRRGTALTTSQ
eukprot:CAMPEP_0117456020 /NCGR_PEP_ID=MMETSP0759-20121206/11661_1 /TAXON_ID=63605 /ORGANISM="Percolomonas cosmopolitus, Strain WS" /LENGTH=2921 /DNA_ID=CAMNT_0005249345 /DNA_START=158 /DNA_END=8920 /DNA_ORIENTATION=-